MRAFAALTFISIVTAASAFAPSCQSVLARRTTSLAAGPLDFFTKNKIGSVKSIAGDYDDAATKKKLDTLIKKTPLLMLSLSTCPYCIKAKKMLDEKNLKYTVIELDKEEDGKAIRAVMGDTLGRTSVPAIWITRNFIGGFNDGPSEYNGLNTLNTKGELDALLKYVPRTKHTSPR